MKKIGITKIDRVHFFFNWFFRTHYPWIQVWEVSREQWTANYEEYRVLSTIYIVKIWQHILTRPVGLVVMCEHWTPKGVCQVTSDIKYGNGQHLNHLYFIKGFPLQNLGWFLSLMSVTLQTPFGVQCSHITTRPTGRV